MTFLPPVPSLGTSAGKAFLVWCLIALIICTLVAVSPNRFFRMLASGPFRSLRPKVIENRWGLLFYRVTATFIFIWVFALVIKPE